MISAFIIDFSWVLVFPHQGQSASRAFHTSSRSWREELSVNEELLGFIEAQGPTSASYIFSGSSPTMLETIRPTFVPPFTDIFSSKELGLSKDNPESYLELARRINKKPEEILFTDDRSYHVEAAEEAGLHGIVFISTEQFVSQATRLLKV